MTLTTLPSLLMNVSTMSLLKLMYFSSTFGIHFIYFLQFCRDSSWKESYPHKLWKITGRILVSWNWGRNLLWATPRYFSVKWQWSLTLSSSPSLNFSLQIQQIFEFLKCFMSASVKTTSFRKSNYSRIILNYSTRVLTKIWAQSSSLLFVLRITGSCLNNFSSKRRENKNHMVCAVDIN